MSHSALTMKASIHGGDGAGNKRSKLVLNLRVIRYKSKTIKLSHSGSMPRQFLIEFDRKTI